MQVQRSRGNGKMNKRCGEFAYIDEYDIHWNNLGLNKHYEKPNM